MATFMWKAYIHGSPQQPAEFQGRFTSHVLAVKAVEAYVARSKKE